MDRIPEEKKEKDLSVEFSITFVAWKSGQHGKGQHGLWAECMQEPRPHQDFLLDAIELVPVLNPDDIPVAEHLCSLLCHAHDMRSM